MRADEMATKISKVNYSARTSKQDEFVFLECKKFVYKKGNCKNAHRYLKKKQFNTIYNLLLVYLVKAKNVNNVKTNKKKERKCL